MSKKTPQIRFKGFTDDWEERKLGQYTKLITKGTTPKDKTGIGDVNFVKVENITNGKIYPINKIKQHEHDNYLKRSRLEEKDILFSIAGTLGRTAIVSKTTLPANTNQALAIIRGYDFDTNFLITSLAGNVVKEYIRRNPTVGAQPNLSLEQVGNLLVNTPNAEEQQKIGSFFKQLDNSIALHQRKLDLLKEQKKGFLQKMFPKNGAKVPELRFSGFADDWEERKLGDVTTWTKGQGLTKEDLNEERDGSEAVHYADLYKFSPVMHEVIHWTNSDDGRIIPDNSLLFPASDVTPVGLARASTLRLSGVKAGGDVIIGQLDESINSSFMSYQINANSKKILPLITGTTVKHVQAKSLATVSVSITNMAEQTAIAGIFERIDNLIALHQRKLNLLTEQKKGFLQKMFVS